MLAHIKRMAEVVGAVVVLYGAFAAVILAFGGNVPPWDTVAHAQSLEQAIKDETKQIKAIQSNVDLLTLERLRDDAKAANKKAAQNPSDAEARSDAWFAQKKLEIFFRSHPALADALKDQ
jgi:hypothetical protein